MSKKDKKSKTNNKLDKSNKEYFLRYPYIQK